jgi:putative sporulation protein YyaC
MEFVMRKCNTFNAFNEYAEDGIMQAIKEYNFNKKMPIIVCVGSDLILGDSLGPLVGTMLKKRNLRSFIYGTLNSPVTAKEVEYINSYLKKMHPESILIAIDAAVGKREEVGLIKVFNYGLKPGLGVNKDLEAVGDISIVGVVAEKTQKNYNLYNLTRLNLVFKFAEIISNGVARYLENELLCNSIKNASV